MGFDPARVDWALQQTKSGGGLQAALDHLEAHQDEPVPEKAADAPAEAAEGDGTSDSAAQANVCTDMWCVALTAVHPLQRLRQAVP